MAKKKSAKAKPQSKKAWLKSHAEEHVWVDYDAAAPDTECIFCASAARYWVEYECGILNHRHPQVPVCKSCCWLLSQTSGGQYTIHTKGFDGREELARMKSDALNAVNKILEDGRAKGTGHENMPLKKTAPRIERDFWHG